MKKNILQKEDILLKKDTFKMGINIKRDIYNKGNIQKKKKRHI